jgi:hypothetical protein
MENAEGGGEEGPNVKGQHDRSGSLEHNIRYGNHPGGDDIAVGK